MTLSLNQDRRRQGVIRIGYVVLVAIVLMPFIALWGVTSYIRLGSDAAALKNSVVRVAPARPRVVVNVGPLTTGVVRCVAGCFTLPPEARMGMRSVRAAEVGVYRLEQRVESLDRTRLLTESERAMRKRGWTRVVGVSHDREIVSVFMPAKVTAQNMRCCVLVMSNEDLVVVSARGNVEEVLEFARDKINFNQQVPLLTAR